MSIKTLFTTAAMVVSFTLPAFAALSVATMSPDTTWTNAWKNYEGGITVLIYKNGLLDLSGKDHGSIYRATCVLDQGDKNVATCVGEGVNHEAEPKRFIYRSKLQWRGVGGERIAEDWECEFADRKSSGKAVFTPMQSTVGEKTR